MPQHLPGVLHRLEPALNQFGYLVVLGRKKSHITNLKSARSKSASWKACPNAIRGWSRKLSVAEEETMEFLVEFDLHVPRGTPESEVNRRVTGEAAASAELGREGHLVRLWRPPVAPGERKALGLYRADSEAELDHLLGALPLSGWMHVTVTPLEAHPNDPVQREDRVVRGSSVESCR